jgi:hypothetical protein
LSAKGVVLIQQEVCYQTTLFSHPEGKNTGITQSEATELLPAAFPMPTESPLKWSSEIARNVCSVELPPPINQVQQERGLALVVRLSTHCQRLLQCRFVKALLKGLSHQFLE